MAFTTSNVKKSYFGNLNVLCGDFTGSAGDAPGTVTVGGGRVYLCEFNDQDASVPFQIEIPFSVSSSGAISTITVYSQSAVATGTFLIIYG